MNMNRIFASIVAVLMLGGGFHEADAESKAPPAHGEEPIGDRAVYLKLDPITTTIFRKDDVAGSVAVALTLQITRESARTEIIGKRRQLRDAMLRELHAMFEREEYTGRKVDVDAIKRRMLVVSRRAVGDDIVVDVFVNAMMRKGA